MLFHTIIFIITFISRSALSFSQNQERIILNSVNDFSKFNTHPNQTISLEVVKNLDLNNSQTIFIQSNLIIFSTETTHKLRFNSRVECIFNFSYSMDKLEIQNVTIENSVINCQIKNFFLINNPKMKIYLKNVKFINLIKVEKVFQLNHIDVDYIQNEEAAIFLMENVFVLSCEVNYLVFYDSNFRVSIGIKGFFDVKGLWIENSYFTCVFKFAKFLFHINLKFVQMKNTRVEGFYISVEKCHSIKYLHLLYFEVSNTIFFGVLEFRNHIKFSNKLEINLMLFNIQNCRIRRLIFLPKRLIRENIKLNLIDSLFGNIEDMNLGSWIYLMGVDFTSINSTFDSFYDYSYENHVLININGLIKFAYNNFNFIYELSSLIKVFWKNQNKSKPNYNLIYKNVFEEIRTTKHLFLYESKGYSSTLEIIDNVFTNLNNFPSNNNVENLSFRNYVAINIFSKKLDAFKILNLILWNSNVLLQNNIFIKIVLFSTMLNIKSIISSLYLKNNTYYSIGNLEEIVIKNPVFLKINGISSSEIVLHQESISNVHHLYCLFYFNHIYVTITELKLNVIALNNEFDFFNFVFQPTYAVSFIFYDCSNLIQNISFIDIFPASLFRSTNTLLVIYKANFEKIFHAYVAIFDLMFSSMKLIDSFSSKNESMVDFFIPFIKISNSRKNEPSFIYSFHYENIYSDMSFLFLTLASAFVSHLNFQIRPLDQINSFLYNIDHETFYVFLEILFIQKELLDYSLLQKSLYVLFLSQIDIQNSTFTNVVFYESGFLQTFDSSILLKNCSFLNLIAFTYSLFKFINDENITIIMCSFSKNLFTDHLMDFEDLGLRKKRFVLRDSSFKTHEEVLFVQTCKNLFPFFEIVSDLHEILFIWPSYFKFLENAVGGLGTCIFYYSSQKMIKMEGVGFFDFRSNTFQLNSDASLVEFKDCDEILIQNSVFLGKKSKKPENDSKFNELEQEREMNVVNLSLVVFKEGNQAINFYTCLFEGFEGRYGAVLNSISFSGETSAKVNLNNCTFLNNTSEKDGGAIYYDSQMSLKVENSVFILNQAKNGGAIFTLSSLSLRNNTFILNRAWESGGAIKWSYFEPFFIKSNRYERNSAVHGNNVASDVVWIKLMEIKDQINSKDSVFDLKSKYFDEKNDVDSQNVEIQTEYEFAYSHKYKKGDAFKVILCLYDRYNQISLINHNFVFQLSVINPEVAALRTPKDSLKDQEGLIIFDIDDIEFFLKNKELPISFENLDNDKLYSRLIISNTVICKKGEVFTGGECTPCPFNSYSLIEDADENTLCQSKPFNAIASYASLIIPQKNFWIKKDTNAVYKCDYTEACIFENPLENLTNINVSIYSQSFGTICEEGYEGPACGRCRDGFDIKENTKCVKCDELANLNLYALFSIVFYIFVNCYLILKSEKKNESDQDNPFGVRIKILLNFFLYFSLIFKRMKTFSDFNRFLTFFPQFIEITGSVSKPLHISSLKCWLENYTSRSGYFFAKTIIIMLFPFLYLFLIIIINFIINPTIIQTFKTFRLRLLVLFFFIHHLFLYDVLNEGLSFLACIHIEEEHFVKKFSLISCDDSHYLTVKWLFIIPYMIFYFFCFPIITLFFLQKNYQFLKNKTFKCTYGFLYSSFHENLFYWEFVVIFQKTLFIFVDFLMEISGNTKILIISWMGIQMIYIIFCFRCKPYKLYKLNRFEIESNIIILFLSTILIGFQSLFEISFYSSDSCPFYQIFTETNDSLLQIIVLFFLIKTIKVVFKNIFFEFILYLRPSIINLLPFLFNKKENKEKLNLKKKKTSTESFKVNSSYFQLFKLDVIRPIYTIYSLSVFSSKAEIMKSINVMERFITKMNEEKEKIRLKEIRWGRRGNVINRIYSLGKRRIIFLKKMRSLI